MQREPQRDRPHCCVILYHPYYREKHVPRQVFYKVDGKVKQLLLELASQCGDEADCSGHVEKFFEPLKVAARSGVWGRALDAATQAAYGKKNVENRWMSGKRPEDAGFFNREKFLKVTVTLRPQLPPQIRQVEISVDKDKARIPLDRSNCRVTLTVPLTERKFMLNVFAPISKTTLFSGPQSKLEHIYEFECVVHPPLYGDPPRVTHLPAYSLIGRDSPCYTTFNVVEVARVHVNKDHPQLKERRRRVDGGHGNKITTDKGMQSKPDNTDPTAADAARGDAGGELDPSLDDAGAVGNGKTGKANGEPEPSLTGAPAGDNGKTGKANGEPDPTLTGARADDSGKVKAVVAKSSHSFGNAEHGVKAAGRGQSVDFSRRVKTILDDAQKVIAQMDRVGKPGPPPNTSSLKDMEERLKRDAKSDGQELDTRFRNACKVLRAVRESMMD
eukprot:7378860-Prymnesium_polylepis.1